VQFSLIKANSNALSLGRAEAGMRPQSAVIRQ